MEANPAPHPHIEQLSDFVLGRLESAALEAVEVHLAACPACCDTLNQIKEDTFVGLVRDARAAANGAGADNANSMIAQPVATELDESAVPLAEAGTLAHVSSPAAATGATEPAVAVQVADIPAELVHHGRYRIEELLGTGGMGAVYKAEHRLMQRTVALKVINPKFMQSKQAVERFRREVQAAGRLQHPNIVHAYDAEQAGDLHYLVMEYVPGTDLGKMLEERGPLPVAEVCEYIRQAALGLQHAHENGMVHRDIKPQNLMVVSGRVVSGGVVKADARSASTNHQSQLTTHQIKILDFGLASLTSAPADDGATDEAISQQKSGLTQAGSLMGTPDYMAPEQAKDARTADIRSDIYSLGCTLYALLAGRVPFPGGTAIDKVIAHSERQPQPLAERRQDIPSAVTHILQKMMSKDPAERFQTPGEVAAALAPLSLGTAAGEGRSRRRTLAATLAAAAAILLAVVIYVTTDNGHYIIESNVDDVQVVISKGGKSFAVLDLKTGSNVKRLPSGRYDVELKGDLSGINLDGIGGFTMTRWGKETVKVVRVAAVAGASRDPPPAIAPFDAAKAKEHQDAWAKHLGVNAEITNPIGMKLRLIPPGKNALGSSGLAESADAFYLGATEVTVAQFRRFVEENKYQTKGEANKLGGMLVYTGKKTERRAAYVWSHADFARSPDHPVTLVTWHDALEFCEWLSRKDGRTYRLPTLAEWKWAERAGSDSRFYFGQSSAAMDGHGWLVGNSNMHTHAVAAKPANPWGLFDVYGNAWELCYDWQRDGKRVDSVRAKSGPGNNDRIVFAGGGYGSAPDEVLEVPSGPPFVGYSHLGFRVAIVGDLKAKSPPEEPGWVQLFNGKDLTGWRKPLENVWSVENGVLVGRGIGLMMVSDREFSEDFHLRCEAKVSDNQFSHVKVRLDPKDSTGYGIPIRGAYWMHGVNKIAAPETPRPPPDVWFDYEIIARGPDVKIKVNGRVFALNGMTVRRGHLGLHTMSPGTIQFRKIEMKELPAPPAPESKSDKELIQGAWKAVAVEVAGQAAPQEIVDVMKPIITFAADKVTGKPSAAIVPKQFLEMAAKQNLLPKDLVAILDKGLEGVYDIDPAKSPKTINVSYLGPVRKTMLGIYTLDADTLKMCLTVDPESVDERPKEFATKATAMRGMITLKRALGAELPDSPRGTYTVKGADGAAWELTFDGTSKFKVTRNGQLGVEGSYKITKDEIEMTDESGLFAEKGATQSGTYRWRLAGSKLIFTVVNDQARGRMVMLMSGAWDVKK